VAKRLNRIKGIYRGVTSPFDIPQGIRAFVDSPKNLLVIEFQYFVEERMEHRADEVEGCNIALYIGVKSKRLRRVEVLLAPSLRSSPTEFPKLIHKIAFMLSHEPSMFAVPEVASKVLSDSAPRFAFANA
jgi:hypothetical protein